VKNKLALLHTGMFKSFKEWLQVKETSASERTRKAAVTGVGHDIPDASVNSRNTFTGAPGMTKKWKDKLAGKGKKPPKKGGGDSKKK
jgi:hypothetical protein